MPDEHQEHNEEEEVEAGGDDEGGESVQVPVIDVPAGDAGDGKELQAG